MAQTTFVQYIPKPLNSPTNRLPRSDANKHMRNARSQGSKPAIATLMIAKEGELPLQRADSDNRDMAQICLPQSTQSSNIEDTDDLLPSEEVISSGFRNAIREADLSKTPALQAVDRSAAEKSGDIDNHNKSTTRRNTEGSQDTPIVLEDSDSDDSNDSASYEDISDIETEQKQGADPSDSLKTHSKTTTLFNSTLPNTCHTKSNTSTAANLTNMDSEIETTEAKSCHSPLKRKAEKIQSQIQRDQSVVPNSDTEGESESDSDFEPPTKKLKAHPYSRCKQGHLVSSFKRVQRSNDQYIAPDDSDLESTDDVQNPSSDQVYTKKQSNKGAMTKLLDIAPTVDDSEAEIDSPLLEMQVGNTAGQQQTCMSDGVELPRPTATTAMVSPLSEPESGIEAPEQMAEVVDATQEWEIHDIVGKVDVDGIVHYWVEWKPSLLPKYALKNAKDMVNTFKAQFQARPRQGNRERSAQLKVRQRTVRKEGTQQKKPRGRPRKQV